MYDREVTIQVISRKESPRLQMSSEKDRESVVQPLRLFEGVTRASCHNVDLPDSGWKAAVKDFILRRGRKQVCRVYTSGRLVDQVKSSKTR